MNRDMCNNVGNINKGLREPTEKREGKKKRKTPV